MFHFGQVNYLLSIGGSSEQKTVANIVHRVYSYDLQASTTWHGIKQKGSGTFTKNPIAPTKIPQLIAGKTVRHMFY